MDGVNSSLAALIHRLCDAIQNFVWELGIRHAAYVFRLEKNLKDLKKGVDDLRALKKYVMRRVRIEEKGAMKRVIAPEEEQQIIVVKRLPAVELWFLRVDTVTAEGDKLLKDGERHLDRLCIGGICSCTYLASSIFGGKVDGCLDDLNELKGQDLSVVTGEAPLDELQEPEDEVMPQKVNEKQQEVGNEDRKSLNEKHQEHKNKDRLLQKVYEKQQENEYGKSLDGNRQEPQKVNETQQEAKNEDGRSLNEKQQEPKNEVMPQQVNQKQQELEKTAAEVIQRTPENGNVVDGELRKTPESKNENRPQSSLDEKQQENLDLLVKCLSQDLGFSEGKPIAACLVYKVFLHWSSFELERTSIFNRIIEAIGSAIEVKDNNHILPYWLSNTSILLLLLQRTLKASGFTSFTAQRRRSASASLFGRMAQGLRASPQSVGSSFLNVRGVGTLDELRQVEPKYPALLFKQQTIGFLEEIYGLIRDNYKKEIFPILGLCIQIPQRHRSPNEQQLIAHWKSIVKVLNDCLKRMKDNNPSVAA